MDLASIDRNSEAIIEERILCVVQPAEAIPVPVVCNLMIIPRRHEGVVLSQKLQVGI